MADLLVEANAALATDGYTPSGDTNRAYQELLKDLIAAGNQNDPVYVQDAACAKAFPPQNTQR